MLYSDRTLGDKVRTLFREQGITVVSIITAIGMAIAALVEGILLATKSAASAVKPKPKPPGPKPKPDPGPKPPGPTPTPDPGGIKEWIKQQLQKIANLLLKLGDKALAALPGIIGSVVSWLLKTVGSVVGFVAEHIWILIITIAGILYNSLQSPNRGRDKKRSA
jgi:hypothetical protein